MYRKYKKTFNFIQETELQAINMFEEEKKNYQLFFTSYRANFLPIIKGLNDLHLCLESFLPFFNQTSIFSKITPIRHLILVLYKQCRFREKLVSLF